MVLATLAAGLTVAVRCKRFLHASTWRALAKASVKEMAGSTAVKESAIVGNKPFRKWFFTISFRLASSLCSHTLYIFDSLDMLLSGIGWHRQVASQWLLIGWIDWLASRRVTFCTLIGRLSCLLRSLSTYQFCSFFPPKLSNTCTALAMQ